MVHGLGGLRRENSLIDFPNFAGIENRPRKLCLMAFFASQNLFAVEYSLCAL